VPTPTDVVEALLFASDTATGSRAHSRGAGPRRCPRGAPTPRTSSGRATRPPARASRSSRSRRVRMITRAEVAPWLVRLARARTRTRLSRPALEALTIIAYKQPVSRPEIDAVRGVNSEAVLDNLLERRLVRITGRKEAPAGRISSRRPRVPGRLRPAGPRRSAEGRGRAGHPEPAGVAEHGEAETQQDPAQAGLTSRRGGDRLIVDGHVAVNGVVTRSPATLADPVLDEITVDGRPLRRPRRAVRASQQAPRLRHALSDPQGRPVVADLVAREVRLYPVGRLDWDVEGALLLTNDGPLTHRLLHPRYALRASTRPASRGPFREVRSSAGGAASRWTTGRRGRWPSSSPAAGRGEPRAADVRGRAQA